MDKISDHPAFKGRKAGRLGLNPTAGDVAPLSPAEFVAGATIEMMGGYLGHHAQRFGEDQAIDIALSVFMTLALNLDWSVDSIRDICENLPDQYAAAVKCKEAMPPPPSPAPDSPA